MLEPLIDAGGGDLAEALTYPLPARTLCLWLGLPDGEWAYLKAIAEELFDAEEGRGDDPATRARCNEELYDYSRRLVRERVEASARPGRRPDLRDLRARRTGTSSPTRTCVQLVRLLITAGHNSTTGGLGNSILRIAREPEIQRRLRAEPALVTSAIEEFLRLETPVQAMPRWANEDSSCTDARSRAGEQVMLFWAAAEPRPRAVRRARPRACSIAPRTTT